MNVTVPYKQIVIPHLESLSETAKITNSVNTIFNKDGKISRVTQYERSLPKE